ncbi:MAG: site-specific integrase [Oscillibacter sp.]|jgi:integrase|nr:site-specific integrase [Oscillibacter sp.]
MKANKPVAGFLAERGGYYHTVINAYVDGKRKPISRTTGLPVKNNLRRAQKILEERKEEYDLHGLSGMLTMEERQQGNSMLFSNYLIKYIERKKGTISPVTYAGYISMAQGRIRRFFDPLGVTVSTLTPQIIEDFMDSIADEGYNGTTQLRYYQVIGACLKNALRKDHIARNPMDKVDRPKKAKYIAAYFTREEAMQLLELVKDDLLYIPVLLGVYYGLRRSEAVGLQWSSVDFETNQIRIDHKAYVMSQKGKAQVIISDEMKTDASRRTLPLIPQVRGALLEHKSKQEEYRKTFRGHYNKAWINCVCVTPTGDIISPDAVTEGFAKFIKKHNLKKVTYHGLRHGSASMLVANGVPMKQIQLWLGHSNYSTTADIYSHLSTAAMDEPANCIANLLTAPSVEKGAEK